MLEKNLNETVLSKHRLLVRKVIGKFVRRLGEPLVRKNMPTEGKRLLAYVERQKRKKQNKRDRERLLGYLGGAGATGDQDDDDSDSDSDEDEQERRQAGGAEEEESDSDDDEEDHRAKNVRDGLQAPAQDIPTADDIPIVSRLARQSMKQRMAGMSGDEALAFKKATKVEQVDNVMGGDDEHLETHFVENPFIKSREKAARKDGKVRLGESSLLAQGGDDDENMGGEMRDEDVYYVKESGKMIVKDHEMEERKRQTKKDDHKKKGYNNESDTDSDDEMGVAKGGSAAHLRKMLKEKKLASTTSLLKRNTASVGIKKDKSPFQLAKLRQQH